MSNQLTVPFPINAIQPHRITPLSHVQCGAINSIPRDLLPIKNNGLDINRAVSTYMYCRYFDHDVTLLNAPNQTAVISWMDNIQDMREELLQTGYILAQSEVVKVACRYNLKCRDHQSPTSLSDVLGIISNKGWYRRDVTAARNVIYSISYGIFRAGWNTWAQKAADKWMENMVSVMIMILTWGARVKALCISFFVIEPVIESASK